MDKNADGVMVALLPITTDWSQLEVPHLTLVYAGKKGDLSPSVFNELAKDASSIAMLSRPVTLRVMGPEVMGSEPDEKVNVLKLLPSSEVWAMRRSLEKWNASEHPFVPHVTVGPMALLPVNQPPYIAFDRICVGWGEEYLTFWLRRQ